MESFGSSEAGKKGGKARAEKLSPEERREIATTAAKARWSPNVNESTILNATHEGEVSFAGTPITCAVLEGGIRVLSERGVTKGFGLKRAGSNWQKKDLSGARMPVFASANNIKPFIDNDLEVALKSPILFRSPNSKGSIAYGVEAELIPRVCEVWLNARDAGVLKSQQVHIAIQADLIMRGLARVGIAALVDEATGYQRDRARDELAKILEAFVAKEIQKWIKTFDLEFYELLCAIRGESLERATKRPAYFGRLTNNLVYLRLAPNILVELKKLSPVDERGYRKTKLFQGLTPEFGHPKLKEHLAGVITAMKTAKYLNLDWGQFLKLLDKTHPKFKAMPLLDGIE
jgi:hypothetical protein